MPVLIAVRARLEQQCHLGSQERDAIAVAGDFGERSPDAVCAPVVDPEGSDRAGQEHLGGQREVLAVQDEAVGGGGGGAGGRGQGRRGGAGRAARGRGGRRGRGGGRRPAGGRARGAG